MKKSLSEIRAMAREDLAGKWSNAVLLTVVYFLIVIPVTFLVNNGSSLLTTGVRWWFINPLAWGFAIAFLNNSRGSESSFGISKLFDGFRDYSRITYTLVLESIYVGLWTLLMAIPSVILYIAIRYDSLPVSPPSIESVESLIILLCFTPCWIILIIKSLSYFLSSYLLKDNPELKNNAAIELSMQMMKGYKMKLLLLNLSFIGWTFLCILTLGVGLLWLIPYIDASCARFYEEVKAEFEQNNVE